MGHQTYLFLSTTKWIIRLEASKIKISILVLLAFSKHFIKFEIKIKSCTIGGIWYSSEMFCWTLEKAEKRKQAKFLEIQMYSHWALKEMPVAWAISKVFPTIF